MKILEEENEKTLWRKIGEIYSFKNYNYKKN